MVKNWLLVPSPPRTEVVYLHMRLGDYVRDPLHLADLRAYYAECISRLPVGVAVHVVTNDKAEAARLYSDICSKYPFAALEDEDDPLEIIRTMAGGRGVICANSSFSWWAGYLHHLLDSRASVVFVPTPWFMDGGARFTSDFGFNGANVVNIGDQTGLDRWFSQ